MRPWFDLSQFPGWAGWFFGTYGRAREWRLHAPDGSHYVAAEVAELRYLILDVDYLRARVREVEAEIETARRRFTPAELATIRAAAALLAGVTTGVF